mmetsp:Transcript_16048/g.55834  ORF Transcript_16048/g.55834 Transcript_16048/m.55834 type:complete len:193 (+) Transcript_16048:357-935(+)
MERSGLPTSELTQIYGASDLDGDGRLNVPEFLVAMVLVARRLGGEALPGEAPDELVEACDDFADTEEDAAAAAGGASDGAAAAAGSAAGATSWAPTEEELASYRAFLESSGLLSTGHPVGADDGVREVLEQSGLPIPELMQIWNLSDADGDGLLSPGELLCAMVLVGGRRSGLDLPHSLPPALLKLGGAPQC